MQFPMVPKLKRKSSIYVIFGAKTKGNPNVEISPF